MTRTDELVSLLARSAPPVDLGAVSRRFSTALCGAALLSMLAMLLTLGVRPDWHSAIGLPMFWWKLAFPAVTACAAFAVLRRLSHPGTRLGLAPAVLAAPVIALWLLAAGALAAAPASARLGLLLGSSWWYCPLLITALAVPAFVVAFRAATRLAPTRLAWTGAAAGLFAGSAAASAYSLFCVEMQPAFLGTWYVLGMLIPAGVGALIGRRVLRW